jgi:hypothetical protein
MTPMAGIARAPAAGPPGGVADSDAQFSFCSIMMPIAQSLGYGL